MQIQTTLWIQLHTNQDWIKIAPKEELLHILCFDKTSRNMGVYQNFILYLESDCRVISDTTFSFNKIQPFLIIKIVIKKRDLTKIHTRREQAQ